MCTLCIVIVLCVFFFTPKIHLKKNSFNMGSSSFPQCLVSEKFE